MIAKIDSTLEPLLGADNFRATASIDCDFTSAEQSEETYDPAKSVMVSSQKTEDMSVGSVAAGIPGTPSTLPRPAARPAGGGNTVTRRTENINYQSSHTVRHLREPEGASSACRWLCWWIPSFGTKAAGRKPNGSWKRPRPIN